MPTLSIVRIVLTLLDLIVYTKSLRSTSFLDLFSDT